MNRGKAFSGLLGEIPALTSGASADTDQVVLCTLDCFLFSSFSLSHLTNSSFKLKQILVPLAELNHASLRVSIEISRPAHAVMMLCLGVSRSEPASCVQPASLKGGGSFHFSFFGCFYLPVPGACSQ